VIASVLQDLDDAPPGEESKCLDCGEPYVVGVCRHLDGCAGVEREVGAELAAAKERHH
jgi:hypothetical protein